MKKFHEKRFPNESDLYREARNGLLDAEINLRRQTEEVAALRRKLPLGGKVKEDYVFDEIDDRGNNQKVKLSELFTPGKDSLIVYSFMFSDKNEKPCTSCNSIADGINGMVFHAEQRVNIVFVAKTSIKRFTDWADNRAWKNLHLLSSSDNDYNKDYFAEDEKGNQWPALNVFRKMDDGIYHFYATELLFAPAEEGQNARHVDSIWPLWNLFDLIPEGRGTDWYPRHQYSGL